MNHPKELSPAQVETHPFDHAMILERQADGRFRGHTSAAYWNMVGPYGGTTAALLLRAVMLSPERAGDPLSLTVNYLAPMSEGELMVDAELVRANRTNQHWSLRMSQGERPVATALAITAMRRETWSHTEARPPVVPRPEQCTPTPRAPLPFLQRYEFRHIEGTPFQAGGSSDTKEWVADNPPRPLDYPSLAALCDAFLPRIFLRRDRPIPISTVSMNIYFHTGAEVLQRHGSKPLLAVANGHVFSDGHFDQQGQLWGDGDALLATTHQIVWYKE